MWLGEYDTSSFDGFEQPNFVDEIHINPGYDSDVPPIGPRHNDMALLKLHTPATLNSRVATISLASAVVSSGTGIAAGWGQTGPTEEEQASTILQRVSLPIRSASACNNAEIGSIRTLKSDELCAGAADGSVGACHGDSGGPFIRAKAGGGFELIGVTSWGALACTSYSVFNRVSSQLSWIRTFVP
jgi:secreted trypsin-like serine protease